MATQTARGYQIKGRPMVCRECDNQTFYTRRTLLNTRGMSFFNWDWLNQDAQNYICADCGHMTWFLEK